MISINEMEIEYKKETFYNMRIGQCFSTEYIDKNNIKNIMIKVSENLFIDIICGNNLENIKIFDATFNPTTKFVLYNIINLDICIRKES